jgi:diacylglycerol kinase (ATP)
LKPGNTGLRRIIKAGGFSWQGLKAAYCHETAFRQELWAVFVLLPCSFLLADTIMEQALLIFCLLLILICEIINSAIEAVVDRHGNEIHELAGRAKDMGSAAVLLAIINAIIIWALIIFSK